jgi:hypothetical protein
MESSFNQSGKVMKKVLILVLTGMLLAAWATTVSAQQGKKAAEERERAGAALAPTGILDRAGGIHNRSNIGEFFENRGKLYARFLSQGASGEFPIGSTKEYIYRINPMVGIPNNVIQGRYTTNEEWEAAAGYNNRDSARVAFSDKVTTWPATGWPVKDANGDPIIVSDQDSYCVYNDSNNTRPILGLQINQTGYAFSLKLIQDMIFFTFDIVNKSDQTYDSLYFALYLDMDIGNFSGGAPEYEDDKMGFNRDLQLAFFYDRGFSSEWPGGTTGYFGMAMLQTPLVDGVRPGVTDLHYNLYDDDLDRDTVQYGIMSSARSLYVSSLGRRFFHVGSNPPNLHFDDTTTIPATGMDILGTMSSGPYTINAGDTLRFVTVMVAGETRPDIFLNTQRAFDLFATGYARPKPPDPPVVSVLAGDRKVTISWGNRSESSRDTLTGQFDFEGYRLYKSIDRGQHWDQIDRNQFPATGPDPVPIASFDKIDGIGEDTGLQYAFVDTSVVNGFDYWYSVTAYDRGDSLQESLENARGNNREAVNLGIATPRSSAIGRTPVGGSGMTQTGSGTSNIVFTALPNDVPEAGDKTYDLGFSPVLTVENGNLRTLMQVGVDSTTPATAHTFSLTFLTPSTYTVRDLTDSARVIIASGVYTSGTPIQILGLRVTLTDTSTAPSQRPEAGDSLLIRLGMDVDANGVEVLPLRPLTYYVEHVTSNGVMISAEPAWPIKSITQTAGSDPLTVTASPVFPPPIIDQTYELLVTSVAADSVRSYLSVELRNAADSLIARDLLLQSGGFLPGQGFILEIEFSETAVPGPGTTVEIRTEADRPLTYNDAFRFTTTGATVDQARATSDLDRIKVVPNPYLVSSQYEEEFGAQRREPIRLLKFNNLPAQCTIHIFTLDGDEVQTIEHNSDNGTENWDMRGAGGREIAPGVYIFVVKTSQAEKIGRFAVIK